MRELSKPDLFMLIISVFLHDIGMAPDEKYILAWKNQLPEEEYDEIDTNTSWSERFKSQSSLSIHGIEVPYFMTRSG